MPSTTALTLCAQGDSCYESGQTTYYWDPSKSMKTVAQTEYAAHPELYSEYVDSSTGITQDNYFYVASLYRLGTAQAAQFQTGNQYGENWHWGTKCSEAGVCNPNAEIINNQLSDPIPRSQYVNSHRVYYNFSAIAAGDADTFYDGASAASVDSLCPHGWQIPSREAAENLLFSSYSFIRNTAEGNAAIKKPPFSMSSDGYITSARGYAIGVEGTYGYTRLWTSSYTVHEGGVMIHSRLNANAEYEFNVARVGNYSYGVNARCVLK